MAEAGSNGRFVITEMTLTNYRCFEQLTIDFHPELTVLLAGNGGGKTSVLDALMVALGPLVGAFDQGRMKGFEQADIRKMAMPGDGRAVMELAKGGAQVEAAATFPGHDSPASWHRSITSASTTGKDAEVLATYGQGLSDGTKDPTAQVTLPVIAYYGTGRRWKEDKTTKRKQPGEPGSSERRLSLSRSAGYIDCERPESSMRVFKDWFIHWSLVAIEERIDAEQSGRAYEPTGYDAALAAVRSAVDSCLDMVGWSNLRYFRRDQGLICSHPEHGDLLVDQLSDGIRSMIGLVADIAFRAVQLNPHLGADACQQSMGVVCIDEVDMHLHPQWQQLVLHNLRTAFPRIQFIVTTPSPQVISTITRESIRVIERTQPAPEDDFGVNDDNQTSPAGEGFDAGSGQVSDADSDGGATDGVDSSTADSMTFRGVMPQFNPLARPASDALTQVFDTHETPCTAELQELHELRDRLERSVRHGESDKVPGLRQKLIELGYAVSDEEIARWDLLGCAVRADKAKVSG